MKAKALNIVHPDSGDLGPFCEEVAEDAGDPGFGFAGELHLDRRAPAPAAGVSRKHDDVGEMEGAAALAFAQLPFTSIRCRA